MSGSGTVLAGYEHFDELCRIWKASFPQDPPEAAADFLREQFRPEECLVYQENGQPVSMVFMLPAEFMVGGDRLPVQYIYAAATLPEYRGRGLFAALLDAAFTQARTHGQVASFLRPGEPGLERYYSRFGYAPFFFADIAHMNRDDLSGAAGDDASVSFRLPDVSYAVCREQALKRTDAFIRWGKRFADYAARQAYRSGGGILTDDEGGCALCEPVGNTLVVRELICSRKKLPAFYGAVMKYFDYQAYEIRRPDGNGNGKSFGMWKPLSKAAGQIDCGRWRPYMGLALD